MAFKKKHITIILFVIVCLASFNFFRRSTNLNIHYTKNYKGDSWQNARMGFIWTLSYLGAELPKGSFDKSIVWNDSSTFAFDYSNIGFNTKATDALNIIFDSVKQTESYQYNKYIDLSQLITLLMGSSSHYYAITNVPKTYSDFFKNKKNNNTIVFPVIKSIVSNHHRNIKFYASDSILNSFYIAEEGEGSLIDNTFRPFFFETIEIMKNGQLRFATYDNKGNLTAATPKKNSSAGKPAKCLWCHEIVISPLFKTTDSLPNVISPNDFMKIIKTQNDLLSVYRKKLNSDIDFTQTQAHTQMELQYISYMEPSIYKLSQEWRLTEREVEMILKHEKKHNHYEFIFLNNLFYRNNILKYTSIKTISLSDSVREIGSIEVNYIK